MVATTIVKLSPEGTLEIPAAFREELGLTADTLVRVTLDGGELRLRAVPAPRDGTGSDWFRELYDLFAPVRQEAIDKGYTEEEINDWIDQAVKEVRAERAARAKQAQDADTARRS